MGRTAGILSDQCTQRFKPPDSTVDRSTAGSNSLGHGQLGDIRVELVTITVLAYDGEDCSLGGVLDALEACSVFPAHADTIILGLGALAIRLSVM